MRYPLVLAVLLLTGCSVGNNVVGATSPEESFVLAETARISGVLGQHVGGEISSKTFAVKCLDGTPCHAAGWYIGSYGSGAKGMAYFWNHDVGIQTLPQLTRMAAHEVCHSLTGPEHNQALWDCIEGAVNE